MSSGGARRRVATTDGEFAPMGRMTSIVSGAMNTMTVFFFVCVLTYR